MLHFQTNHTHGAGNALQACVATILGTAHLEDVPNATEDSRGYLVALTEFLACKQPAMGFVKVPCVEGKLPLPMSSGIRCVFAGKSPRGEHRHCCVGIVLNDGVSIELSHDPHSEGLGIDGPALWVGFICLR